MTSWNISFWLLFGPAFHRNGDIFWSGSQHFGHIGFLLLESAGFAFFDVGGASLQGSPAWEPGVECVGIRTESGCDAGGNDLVEDKGFHGYAPVAGK